METVNMTPKQLKAFEEAQKKQNKIPSLFEMIWREIWRDKFAFVSLIIMFGILIASIIGGAIFDGMEINFNRIILGQQNLSPAEFGPLGTDSGGRPIIAQLFLGARNSLFIAFAVTLASLFIGYLVGLIAGFYGGVLDLVIMRLIDMLVMVPFIMVLIVVSQVLPRYGIPQFIMLMIAFSWFAIARTFRARVLQEAAKDYVLASKTLGTPNWKIMIKKVLPNVTSFMMVGLVLGLAGNIGLETGLTVIGFGLPFGTPSIGAMIASALDPTVLQSRPWQWVPAAILIFVMTLSIYGVGSAVSRAVNPKQRR